MKTLCIILIPLFLNGCTILSSASRISLPGGFEIRQPKNTVFKELECEFDPITKSLIKLKIGEYSSNMNVAVINAQKEALTSLIKTGGDGVISGMMSGSK